LALLYGRLLVPGRASAIKVLTEAVRQGLPPPSANDDDELLAALGKAVDELVSERYIISDAVQKILQAFADGHKQDYIAKHPELFGEDVPITQSAVAARCRTVARHLGLDTTVKLFVVALWAEKVKLKPVATHKLNEREVEYLDLAVSGLSRSERRAQLKVSVWSLELLQVSICAKLEVRNFAQAIVVAVSRRLITLPLRLVMQALRISDLPAAAGRGELNDFIKRYERHSYTFHPERAKGSDTGLGELMRNIGASVPLMAVAIITQAGLVDLDDVLAKPAPLVLAIPEPVTDEVSETEDVNDGDVVVQLAPVTPVRPEPDLRPAEVVIEPDAGVIVEPVSEPAPPDALVPVATPPESPALPPAASAAPAAPPPPAPPPRPQPNRPTDDMVIAAVAHASVNDGGQFVFAEATEQLIEQHFKLLLRAARDRRLQAPQALRPHLAFLKQTGLDPVVLEIIQAYVDGVNPKRINNQHGRPGQSAKARVMVLWRHFKARNLHTVILFAVLAELVRTNPDRD
jgi:DNA-binding CsgD family transcriptional regulator